MVHTYIDPKKKRNEEVEREGKKEGKREGKREDGQTQGRTRTAVWRMREGRKGGREETRWWRVGVREGNQKRGTNARE